MQIFEIERQDLKLKFIENAFELVESELLCNFGRSHVKLAFSTNEVIVSRARELSRKLKKQCDRNYCTHITTNKHMISRAILE